VLVSCVEWCNNTSLYSEFMQKSLVVCRLETLILSCRTFLLLHFISNRYHITAGCSFSLCLLCIPVMLKYCTPTSWTYDAPSVCVIIACLIICCLLWTMKDRCVIMCTGEFGSVMQCTVVPRYSPLWNKSNLVYVLFGHEKFCLVYDLCLEHDSTC
jgi:hypothetical protein